MKTLTEIYREKPEMEVSKQRCLKLIIDSREPEKREGREWVLNEMLSFD